MISAISVKDRLKNQAASSGKTFQEALTAYGLERTVYRLSISEYKERFTLKGGIFLYALFDGEFARATRDIDLLAKNMPNNVEDMKRVFENIFSIECDDALKFDQGTLDVRNISEFKEYHGVNVSIMAYLDKTRVPVSIDVGFGDVIYPGRVKMNFPVLLDMDVPEIYVYSISSVVAEKFEAIFFGGEPMVKLPKKTFEKMLSKYRVAGTFENLNRQYAGAIEAKDKTIAGLREQISSLKSKLREFTDFVSECGLMEAFKEFIRPKSMKEKLEIGKQKSKEIEMQKKKLTVISDKKHDIAI